MSTGLAYYRGGPKDGRLLLASDHDGYLVFDQGPPPHPRYKLTSDTIVRNGKTYHIAEYVPPGQA